MIRLTVDVEYSDITKPRTHSIFEIPGDKEIHVEQILDVMKPYKVRG